jgi:RHS repeat-associated protein
MYAVCSLPFALELNEIPHSVWNEAGKFRHDAVWAAMSAGDADAAVRWDFCRLDFLFLFDQAKRKEENNMNGRFYDPVIGRFFSPDKYVANSSFTQDFNRYSYARNNPLMYTDPDGEFIKYVVWAFHAFSQGLENWLNGVSNPWKSAAQDASNFVNGVNNAGKITIFQNDKCNVNAGVDMFNFGASFNASFTTKRGLTLGANAGYSIMGGWFVGGGISQEIDGFKVGANIGAGNNYWGWNTSIDYKGYGVGYGQTYYGSAPSAYDGQPHRQYTGTFSVNTPYSTFRMQNDFWGDGFDRWRTSAFEASFGPFVIGSYLYTNAPEGDPSGNSYTSKFWKKSKDAYPDGKVYSSTFYIGLRVGNMVTRIGINHPKVQDITLNGWHLLINSPLFPTPYGEYSSPYYYFGYYNPYSLYP